MQQNRLGALRRVQLVFVVRNTADMSWFHSLFRQLEEVRTNAEVVNAQRRAFRIRSC